MNANEFIQAMHTRYDVQPDYPWQKFPKYAVFRHADNSGKSTKGKWFCLLMEISADKLGLPHCDSIEVINLKTDPIFIGSLLQTKGVFPAYHMNKEHWISVHLGQIEDDVLWQLVDDSHHLTHPIIKKSKK